MKNAGQDMTNRPITYVSCFDAARFANWMANGQPVGAQGNATTENGAYTMPGAMSGVNFPKNPANPNNGQAVSWWIPSENEWYKASLLLARGKHGQLLAVSDAKRQRAWEHDWSRSEPSELL